MSIAQQFKRAIIQEMAADMRINQFTIAAQKTGQDLDHRDTRSLALQLSIEQSAQLRASCYIFGDTFEGQPLKKTHEILTKEGFSCYNNNLDDQGALYTHESLGIIARVKSKKGSIEKILLICNYNVNTDLIPPDCFNGLGATGEIINDNLECTVDATYGLSTKMHVLRSFATDGSLV